jgi:hypothetical protein
LRAAGAGNDAELYFRQAQSRAGRRDPKMAAEGDFEPAAQRGAEHRRDKRLLHRFHEGDDFRQAWRSERLAEFRDIGARHEGAALGGKHDGTDIRVRRRGAHRFENTESHRVLQGVDRRIVH